MAGGIVTYGRITYAFKNQLPKEFRSKVKEVVIDPLSDKGHLLSTDNEIILKWDNERDLDKLIEQIARGNYVDNRLKKFKSKTDKIPKSKTKRADKPDSLDFDRDGLGNSLDSNSSYFD